MNLEMQYMKVKEAISSLDLGSIWPGFKPLKFALYDDEKCFFDGQYVCRHTFCSRMASARMNPKTLQYIMGHSDISVTLNTYTHLGFDDALEEMTRISKAKDTKNHEDDTVVLKDFSEYKGKASNE